MKLGQSPTCLFPISQVQLQVESGHIARILSPTGRSGQSEEKPILSAVIGKSNGQRSETAESHAAAIRGSCNKNSCVSPWSVSVEAVGNPELSCLAMYPSRCRCWTSDREQRGRAELNPSASLSLVIPELTWGGCHPCPPDHQVRRNPRGVHPPMIPNSRDISRFRMI